MKHLVKRFFGSLYSPRLDAVEQAWVHDVLSDPEFDLWKTQATVDQRHSFDIAHLSFRPTDATRDERAGALLHDIGKIDARLGVVVRHRHVIANTSVQHVPTPSSLWCPVTENDWLQRRDNLTCCWSP